MNFSEVIKLTYHRTYKDIRLISICLMAAVWILCPQSSDAQVNLPVPTIQKDTSTVDTIPDGGSRLQIYNSDNLIIEEKDSMSIQYLTGNVKARQDSTYFFADKAIRDAIAFLASGNVTILQNDTIQIFCDSLHYTIDSSLAILVDNVSLINGDQELYTDTMFYNADLKIATYDDTAIMIDKGTKFQSKNGRFDIENKVSYFDKEVILSGDKFILRTEYLTYYTEEKKAEFSVPTRIKTEDGEIYCESGYYLLNSGEGVFRKNAQYRKDNEIVTGDVITYREDGTIEIEGSTTYVSDDGEADAGSMTFNEETEDLILLGKATFSDDSTQIKGERIISNDKTGELLIAGDGYYKSNGRTLSSSNIEFNTKTEIGYAEYDVVYTDSTSDVSLRSDYIDIDNGNNYFLAYNYSGKPELTMMGDSTPLLIIADSLKSYQTVDTLSTDNPISVGADTLLELGDSLGKSDTIVAIDSLDAIVAVDTLLKIENPDSISVVDSLSVQSGLPATPEPVLKKNEFFEAIGHVNIFREEIEAVSDRCLFDKRDSVFILTGNPIMWSDSTQFTSDTILLYLKDGKMDKMELLQNAIILNETDEELYNQIKGKKVTAYFKNDSLNNFVVEGNAESIYYVKDEEEKYIAVNKTECSLLKFLFSENEISDIKGYVDVKQKMIPMKDANHEALKLEGVSWKGDLKPKRPEKPLPL